MCGRFAFYSPAEAVTALFCVEGHVPVEPRYNIAPTQFVAAVRSGRDEQRELTMLRWGLVPFWAKETSIGNRMINARAETVAEKPAYRAAYRTRRCVVLADGFYEWHRQGNGNKTPYFVSRVGGEPFAFAALWESWHDNASDDSLETTVIVTTAANAFMKQLHQRMPLVLEPEGASRWLRGDTDLLEATATAPKMQAWPVSRTVNNARNEGENLIEPAGAALTGE